MQNIKNFEENRVMLSDSYKYSHYLQYPRGTVNMYDYAEARSLKEYDKTLFFGLQMMWKKYFTKKITIKEVDEASMYAKAHGIPFNLKGWKRIVRKYKGRLPVTIKAVPEGTVIPNKMVLFTVELTINDKEIFWLPSWLETFLMKVWYTCNVATRSYFVKEMLLQNAKMTSDEPFVDFQFHNFSDRGSSSVESAAMGAVGHLTCFKGTDNFNSLKYANVYYNEPIENIGFSIPATEHSSTTAWTKEGEFDMIMIHLENNKGNPLMASVMDSYDIFKCTDAVTSGEFKRKIESDEYPIFVQRPDSGYGPDIINEMINIMEKNGVKYTENSKGYKIWDKYRIILGDGVTMQIMNDILTNLRLRGYDASNISFGSGGWLQTLHNRDTLGFAIKCSNITLEDGSEIEVYKDPITDPGKKSKKGKVTTYFDVIDNEFFVDKIDSKLKERCVTVLETVIENGVLIKEYTLTDIRTRVNKQLAGVAFGNL